jgi:hypothetical protein
MRIAIGKRVEPGAEQDILPHTASHGGSQLAFGHAATGSEYRPQKCGSRRKLVAVAEESLGGSTVGVCADDPQRQRIVEDSGVVE